MERYACVKFSSLQTELHHQDRTPLHYAYTIHLSSKLHALNCICTRVHMPLKTTATQEQNFILHRNYLISPKIGQHQCFSQCIIVKRAKFNMASTIISRFSLFVSAIDSPADLLWRQCRKLANKWHWQIEQSQLYLCHRTKTWLVWQCVWGWTWWYWFREDIQMICDAWWFFVWNSTTWQRLHIRLVSAIPATYLILRDAGVSEYAF